MISLVPTPSSSSVDDSKAIVPANFHEDAQPSSLRTLSAVREQVAQEIAMRTVNKAQVVDVEAAQV
ncbi:hypothetical protein PM082_021457 [Marasmius tenuissimus]|nr:hypothetical protein PM082_021457 [Marasmius tenuissimus]